MSPPGSWNQFVTEDKARLIAMELLEEYEQEKVEPRHRETQASLKRIEKFQYIAYGGFLAVVFIIKVVLGK